MYQRMFVLLIKVGKFMVRIPVILNIVVYHCFHGLVLMLHQGIEQHLLKQDVIVDSHVRRRRGIHSVVPDYLVCLIAISLYEIHVRAAYHTGIV